MTDDSKLLPIETTPKLNKEDQEFADELIESLNNYSNKIDWQYWLNLPLWTAEEAIYLISLIDPNRRDEDKEFLKLFPKNSGVAGAIEKLNNKVTLAEREQQAGILCHPISPQIWVGWAMNKGYKIPSQLLELSEKLKQFGKLLKHGRDLFGLTIIGKSYIVRHANGGSTTTNKGTYEDSKVEFNQLLANGRYTLNDAALAIEEGTHAPAKDMVNKLCLAAEKGTLKMYDPNTRARWLYGERFNLRVSDYLEVTTYSELNNWLNENEPLLSWRFPEPNSSDNVHEFTNQLVIADDVNNGDDIEGKMPNIAVGGLAVTAAWSIEKETKRTATAKQVMTKLQEWADTGAFPDCLMKSDKPKKSVIWITNKSAEKPYTIQACCETLRVWNNSRNK